MVCINCRCALTMDLGYMFCYLFDEIIAEFGDVDALVGCVGYMGWLT
jgi:hypothetical protein